MPKPKSSRGAARKTPQPKPYTYVEAVFIDDYGRDRALSLASAKSFSKKKSIAPTQTMRLQTDRRVEIALRRGDWETARAIRKLRKAERQADIEWGRLFRRLIRTKVRIPKPIKHGAPKRQPHILPTKWPALPKYDSAIRDSFNRRSVFARFRYYSSRTARPGVCRRVTTYIFRGSELDHTGTPMMCTNVGETIEEAVAGFDHLEQVNWSARKGAKILNHAILAMDHRWTPEQMLELGQEWAEQSFGQHDLPYCVCLHAPPEDGDERNWHLHVVWSWRPLERVGDHSWMVGENLRTDLDGAQGMRALRENFAHLMTAMAFRSGHADVYTALSYAARGLPVEPQIHLDEGRTRQARAGKFVAANEENFERVLRSQAALADDELRRAEGRLAEWRAVAERARQRFARLLTVPAPPAARFAVSRRPRSLDLATEFVAPPIAPMDKQNVPAPAARRYIVSTPAGWADRISALQENLRGIANLRIIQPVRAIAAPRGRFETSAPLPPSSSSRPTLPVFTQAAPMPVLPMRKTRVSRIPNPPAVIAAITVSPVRAHGSPKPPPKSFKLQTTFANLRKVKVPSRVPAVATTAGPPAARSFKVASLPSICKPASIFPPMDQTTLVRFAAERWRVEAIVAKLAEDEAKAAAARQVSEELVRTRQNEDACRALLNLLDEEQFLLLRDRDGVITVPGEALTRAGFTELTTGQRFQEQLQLIFEQQQRELTDIARHLASDGKIALVHGVWRFDAEAPEDAKFALFKWRNDDRVTAALSEFAKVAEVDRKAFSPHETEGWFLARVNGETTRPPSGGHAPSSRFRQIGTPDRGLGD